MNYTETTTELFQIYLDDGTEAGLIEVTVPPGIHNVENEIQEAWHEFNQCCQHDYDSCSLDDFETWFNDWEGHTCKISRITVAEIHPN